MSMKAKIRKIFNQRSSILIEVLLSIVILSTSITVVIQAMTASLRASANASGYTTALMLLENKMTDLLQGRFIEPGLHEEKDFPEPYQHFKYSLAADPFKEEAGVNLNDLRISVAWASGKKQNKINLETYFIKAVDEN